MDGEEGKRGGGREREEGETEGNVVGCLCG
jgi:hypothetical protein